MKRPSPAPRTASPARAGRTRTAKNSATGYFQRVYAVVATIPRGKVMTYGQIAEVLGGGRSGRVVGYAMRAAPAALDLPCHRVVNRLGTMAPGLCFGGADRQHRLLRREGVKFKEDGHIDFSRSRYQPPM